MFALCALHLIKTKDIFVSNIIPIVIKVFNPYDQQYLHKQPLIKFKWENASSNVLRLYERFCLFELNEKRSLKHS